MTSEHKILIVHILRNFITFIVFIMQVMGYIYINRINVNKKLMDSNYDNLKRLFDNLKYVSFFRRLFGWTKIKNQLIDAAIDLQKLISNTENQKEELAKIEAFKLSIEKDLRTANENVIRKDNEIENLNRSIEDANRRIEKFTGENSSQQTTIKAHEDKLHAQTIDLRLVNERNTHLIAENKKLSESAASNSESIINLNERKSGLEAELIELKASYQSIRNELTDVKKLNTQLQKDEEFRQQEHSTAASTLSAIHLQIQTDRNKELEDRNATEIERLKQLKETWSRHQDAVKNVVKTLCQRHTIQYIEKVPFKGDPDNTLLICEEYVIFDAKSPGGEILSNFPGYLKDQAEKAKKYAKQDCVKTDVFFVVPSNTLDYLSTFVYKHGDHNVYIISLDALEPVLLSLKKIEEYEFVEQLSPEDRENICRVIGQFAHLSKRRIQVDSFFARQFIELAYKCESDLPPDILKTVIDFEKTGKLNPPLERRAKSIPIAEIETESKKIKLEADGRGIIIQDETISQLLNEIPLYKKTEE